MRKEPFWSIDWPCDDGTLRVTEPTPDEVDAAAARLAACYNEPYNRGMLGHEADLSVEEVVEHYARMRTAGAHPFLLEREGRLAGDADLRHVAGPAADFAILVGERAAQGRGLGTRFALLVHVVAFQGLGLERVYSSVIPANRPSLRMLEKIGYLPDDGPEARARAEEPTDVTLSIDRARFEALHAATLEAATLVRRPDV